MCLRNLTIIRKYNITYLIWFLVLIIIGGYTTLAPKCFIFPQWGSIHLWVHWSSSWWIVGFAAKFRRTNFFLLQRAILLTQLSCEKNRHFICRHSWGRKHEPCLNSLLNSFSSVYSVCHMDLIFTFASTRVDGYLLLLQLATKDGESEYFLWEKPP